MYNWCTLDVHPEELSNVSDLLRIEIPHYYALTFRDVQGVYIGKARCRSERYNQHKNSFIKGEASRKLMKAYVESQGSWSFHLIPVFVLANNENDREVLMRKVRNYGTYVKGWEHNVERLIMAKCLLTGKQLLNTNGVCSLLHIDRERVEEKLQRFDIQLPV